MNPPNEKNRILKIVSILDTPAFNLIFGGIGILLFLLTYLGYINLILCAVFFCSSDIMLMIECYLYYRYIDVDPPKENVSQADQEDVNNQ